MSMTKRELAAQNEALRELLANVQALLGDTLAEVATCSYSCASSFSLRLYIYPRTKLICLQLDAYRSEIALGGMLVASGRWVQDY